MPTFHNNIFTDYFAMNNSSIIHTSSAIFWDGAHQLSGTLVLTKTTLLFKFEDFQHSHLNLQIPLINIKIAKPFLLFKVARKGLKIVSDNEKVDMFILEDSKMFYNILQEQINKIGN